MGWLPLPRIDDVVKSETLVHGRLGQVNHTKELKTRSSGLWCPWLEIVGRVARDRGPLLEAWDRGIVWRFWKPENVRASIRERGAFPCMRGSLALAKCQVMPRVPSRLGVSTEKLVP